MKFTPQEPIWTPLAPTFTTIEAFRREINRKHPHLRLRNYHDLHEYSVSDYQFWADLWEYFEIIYSVSPSKVIEPGPHPQNPSWFPGARLNYAENLLRNQSDSLACTTVNELGTIKNYTFRQLRTMVAQVSAGFRARGLAPGDRVAAVITNSIEAIVLALATASIGGIYTTTAPDMGVKGILDRYRQVRPKFLFMETEVYYAGKTININPKAGEVIEDLKKYGLEVAVTLPSRVTQKDVLDAQSITMSDFIASGDGKPLQFSQLPFNHPLYILYSSGTTGPPKCIIHCAGGILMQTMKDAGFCFAIGHGDTLFQYTTAGWMMWNFMLSVLAYGARLIVYDGSPMHPSLEYFMNIVDSQNVTALGVSPRFLSVVQGSQGQGSQLVHPGKFEALRTIAVGGAVLSPSLHEWAQRAFGPSTRVMTAMGGTDVCSAFVTSVLSLPVYAGEIPCKTMGMKIEVFNESGDNIEHTGEPGEMVCTRPHPSIPIGFWGDHTGSKFLDTYFGTYKNVWRQGDFIVVNPLTKGLLVHGRSDGVLNPRGVRFGSGEIYAVLEQFQPIMDDYICVGQRREKDLDEQVLLFIKMAEGHNLTKDLMERVRLAIRTSLSPRHVPAYIFQVKDIPCTINGKKIEVAVKQLVSGQKIKASGAVANPEAFTEYYKYVDVEQVASECRSKL